MTRKTVLNDTHRALGAKMVDFGGWDMPIHYGSQLDEHHLVRRAAGMFDVSHMTVVDLEGARTREFLRHLVANSIDKLQKPGRALYTAMLNERGGVIDDLITYYMDEAFFRLVVNAATRDKDLAWIGRQAQAFGVEVIERPDFAMVAVQGPQARESVIGLLRESDRAAAAKLGRFAALEAQSAAGVPLFLARTGYTGEDGFEIVLPEGDAVAFWNALLEAGVKPAGLGARDTLRLEAGMNLYGQDMDEGTTPWEAALGASIPVPTLGGEVELKVPAGSASGKRLRLKGRGLPGATAGDQYVELAIQVPPASDERATAFYEDMAKRFKGFDPRR